MFRNSARLMGAFHYMNSIPFGYISSSEYRLEIYLKSSSAPDEMSPRHFIGHTNKKPRGGLFYARLMGADPTASRVTGECSTVELQPHFFKFLKDFLFSL